MWKYKELDAYDSISLHDCRADNITNEGADLIFDFPDGFWITPASNHIDHDRPLKTGPAQLQIHTIFEDDPFGTIDLFKHLLPLWETASLPKETCQKLVTPILIPLGSSGYTVQVQVLSPAWIKPSAVAGGLIVLLCTYY